MYLCGYILETFICDPAGGENITTAQKYQGVVYIAPDQVSS